MASRCAGLHYCLLPLTLPHLSVLRAAFPSGHTFTPKHKHSLPRCAITSPHRKHIFYLSPHQDNPAEKMPDTNKASHTVLAPALAAPADHQHQELLDEPKALSATAEMSPALFAREAGGSNNSPSSADSDGLDPETFNFSPFIRDRQGPADIRGQLTTREELFSSILRPLPLACESRLPACSLRL